MGRFLPLSAAEGTCIRKSWSVVVLVGFALLLCSGYLRLLQARKQVYGEICAAATVRLLGLSAVRYWNDQGVFPASIDDLHRARLVVFSDNKWIVVPGLGTFQGIFLTQLEFRQPDVAQWTRGTSGVITEGFGAPADAPVAITRPVGDKVITAEREVIEAAYRMYRGLPSEDTNIEQWLRGKILGDQRGR